MFLHRVFWGLASVAVVACGSTTTAPPEVEEEETVEVTPAPDPIVEDGTGPGPDEPPFTRFASLDLVVVVDDSRGMQIAQERFAAGIQAFIETLLSTDASSSGESYADIRVGLLSSSLPLGVAGVAEGCAESGDDVGTFTYPVNADPACQDATVADGAFVEAGGASLPVDDAAAQLSCAIAAFDDAGCGFERPLDAALSAVTPADGSVLTFAPSGAGGVADTTNSGFFRDDADLGVLLLTAEDDCSAADSDLYDPDNEDFFTDGVPNLNLRCANYATDSAMHPPARYVDALVALKGDARRTLFAVIAGMPAEASTATIDDLLMDDAMAYRRADAELTSFLANACETGGADPEIAATPARRLLRVAQGLEAQGGLVAYDSLCAPTTEAATATLTAVATRLRQARVP